MAEMTARQIVQADADWIYIGNIYTVEADLILPVLGKNGAAIAWATDMPHIINASGKVVRPREGAGNREVTLTATVSHNGETAARQFLVTVLALKSDVKIVAALDIIEEIAAGSAYELPGVCIVQKDDDTFATAVVKWLNEPDFAKLAIGTHEIFGEMLADTNITPKAVITINAAQSAAKIPNIVANRANYGDAKIKGGYFNDNRLRAEEFLIGVNLDTQLYNFRAAAGLDLRGAEPMSGWDAPEGLLRGHTTGHFMSGIALAYAGKTENQAKFGEMIEYMVNGMAECQDAMEKSGNFAYGFLSGYSEEQFDKLEEYVVYPKIWAPYYTLHKIIAGLIDCYEYAGNARALDVAQKIGIWMYNRLSKLPKEQLQKMWAMYIAGEFGGINESLAKLGKHFDDERFLAAAKLFDNDRLFYPMSKNIDTLGGIHGNQHVPQIIGALEIFARNSDKRYYDIARNFWQIATDAHIYNIGGSGEGEMFQDPHKIGTKLSEKTAESCVSYNMLKLTAMLFEYEPRASYMDYFEKTLYNHIAATQDQSGAVGGSTYFMPLLPGGKKGYDVRGNTCCHGTGLENHVKYQDSIYYQQDKAVYVNLYIPSVLDVADSGSIAIEGDFLSKSGGHKATIKVLRGGFDELRLRVPSWSKGGFKVSLNDTTVQFANDVEYFVINNPSEGSVLTVEFDFKLKVVQTVDAPDVAALYYGPLVLVLTDDSDDFITLDKGFENKLEQVGDFEFRIGGHRFVPNYYAWDTKYHAYFKIC